MRITAGKHRSRVLTTLEGDNTRPTSSKAKEAIFSRIGPYFSEGIFLDLFAGSGSMGFEAISRGMSHCYFVEVNKNAQRIVNDNIRTLKEEENCTLLKMDYLDALKYLARKEVIFDVVFIDPPYKKIELDLIINYLISFNLVAKDGKIIVESLKDEIINIGGNVEIIKEAIYGITKISYFKRKI